MSTATPPVSLRRTRAAVLGVTLLVFAAVITYVTLRLRDGLREQILRREGDTLAAVASLQLANSQASLAELGLTDAPGELVSAVLQASKLRGVLAMRVFDEKPEFAGALPWIVSEEPPEAADWGELTAGRPVTRLHPRETLEELVGLPPQAKNSGAALPLLEAWVPLVRAEGGKLAGAAQFWIDGRALAAEFSALDRRLAAQAVVAWLAGALIIGVALMWAFRRLAESNRALQARTEDLQRANRELALAARTSALGTVTAHLIHGLKNPLAGLEIFLSGNTQPGGRAGGEGEEWQAANELTQRLRTMVDEVVAVLRDEQGGTSFELSCTEVAGLALEKAKSFKDGVMVTSEVIGAGTLPGRRANLALLILQNLLQNAVEAGPRGSTVRLTVRADHGGEVEFLVEDHGPGLPTVMRERLFQPCQSSKPGGSGLGLALSHQLAQQAGGRLELVRSDATGSCFRLSFPAAA